MRPDSKPAIAANMAEYALYRIKKDPWFGMKSERTALVADLEEAYSTAVREIFTWRRR